MTKRKRSSRSTQLQPAKRSKVDNIHTSGHEPPKRLSAKALHPLLNKCYPEVKSLKCYILDQLPPTSRLRKRQLSYFERENTEQHDFLNKTLVGIKESTPPSIRSARLLQLSQFTQAQRSAHSHSAAAPSCSLDEVNSVLPLIYSY